jgi:hypothetical protein
MIIIWKGAGALVLIFGIISALIVNMATSATFSQNNYFADHSWAQALSLWITGAASWFMGKYLNSRPAKMGRDKLGNELLVEPNHHLMFIKMQYWGPIFLAIGILVLAWSAVKH